MSDRGEGREKGGRGRCPNSSPISHDVSLPVCVSPRFRSSFGVQTRCWIFVCFSFSPRRLGRGWSSGCRTRYPNDRKPKHNPTHFLDAPGPDQLGMQMQLSISTPFLAAAMRPHHRAVSPPDSPSLLLAVTQPLHQLGLPRMTVQHPQTQGPTPNLWPFR